MTYSLDVCLLHLRTSEPLSVGSVDTSNVAITRSRHRAIGASASGKRGRTATIEHSFGSQEAHRKRCQVRVSRNHVSRPEAEQLRLSVFGGLLELSSKMIRAIGCARRAKGVTTCISDTDTDHRFPAGGRQLLRNHAPDRNSRRHVGALVVLPLALGYIGGVIGGSFSGNRI